MSKWKKLTDFMRTIFKRSPKQVSGMEDFITSILQQHHPIKETFEIQREFKRAIIGSNWDLICKVYTELTGEPITHNVNTFLEDIGEGEPNDDLADSLVKFPFNINNNTIIVSANTNRFTDNLDVMAHERVDLNPSLGTKKRVKKQ